MNAEFDYQKGRADERATIVAFLRRHTNLTALAALLEDGQHTKTPRELADYAARHKLGRFR